MTRLLGTLALVGVFAATVSSSAPAAAQAPGRKAGPQGKPAPTMKDAAYGPHERNVLDLWQADAEKPAPLVVYIHGGGFRGGDKNSLNAATLRELLKAGISVAAVNYRLIDSAPLPAAHDDCRRALQFLRSKAGEWNIDKSRVGAFGGSAGAQLCMYLAFHDELADPGSEDPRARESTRLACVATNGGQTTMDIAWWQEHIPGYDAPHRDFRETFGAESEADYRKKVADVSALSLISKDDPPIFMTYAMRPDDPVPEGARAQGWKVHHVVFGEALKEKMDALGIEAELKYPGARSKYASVAEFFIAKLAEDAEPQHASAETHNHLTDEEKQAGWKLLFDGETTKGWRGYKREKMPPGWKVIDGALVRVSGGAGGLGAGGGDDIVTLEQYDDFELTLQWKIVDRAGNSGLILRASEDAATSWHTGPEMQILDNAAYPGRDVRQLAGACYDLYAPQKDVSRPRGEWNTVRVVAKGPHIEHWLNGEKLLEYELGSDDWDARVAKSKFKNMSHFQNPPSKGHICLQDHTARIEYRNIKIRPLKENAEGGKKQETENSRAD